MTDINCRLCGSFDTEVLRRRKFAPIKGVSFIDEYEIRVCRRCGFGFAAGIPEQDEFDRYYAEQSKYDGSIDYGKESERDFSAYVNLIGRYKPDRNTAVAEIGCGTSGLLNALRMSGYNNLTGADPSQSCVDYITRRYGINGVRATLNSLDAGAGAFGVLIMIGVLEHIRELNRSMRKIHSLLSPGGLLLTDVPDVRNFNAVRTPPFQEFSIEHINYFSAGSLANLASINGFSQTETAELSNGGVVSVMLKTETAGDLVPSYDDKRCLEEYIRQSESVDKTVLESIKPYYQKPVVVWGAGTYARHLLADGALNGCDLVAVVDNSPHYQNGSVEFKGSPIRVTGPAELAAPPDVPIIIASQFYQDEIASMIKKDLGLENPIVTLFKL